MSKLTTITKDLFDRVLATKRITALTGGLRKVDSVVITAGGSGYNSAPTVGFTGGGGSGAAATATVANGIVVAVTMTNLGSGYTSTPGVTFTPVSGGTGAAATAIMSPTTLDAVTTTDKAAGEFVALVGIGTEVNPYALVAGTDAESSPDVIRPDDYATTTNEKVWKRRTFAPDQSGSVFTQTADQAVTNTTTETTLFGSGVGSKNFAANTLLAGMTVRFRLAGKLDNAGSVTETYKIKLGSVTLLTVGPATTITLAGGDAYVIEGEITCRTAGASGSFIGNAMISFGGGATYNRSAVATAGTIDTTASNSLDVTVTFGTASALTTITNQAGKVELLRASA